MWGLNFQLLQGVGVRGGGKQQSPSTAWGHPAAPTQRCPHHSCAQRSWDYQMQQCFVFFFFSPFPFHLSCLVNTPASVKRSPFRSHLCYFGGLQMQGAACFPSLISVQLPGSRSRIWAWEVGSNELQSLGQCSALEQRGSEVVGKLGRSTESFQMFFLLNIHPPPLFLPLSL